MTEQNRPNDPDDDVAGHLSPRPTGIHDPVTDDTEGRRFPVGGEFSAGGGSEDEPDDVAGHGLLRPTDPKQV